MSDKSHRPLLVIGWMEYIDLPGLGLTDLKAKIDTGARTSAINASDIERFERDGADWVRFRVTGSDPIECPVYTSRNIMNTGGVTEHRIIVRTRMRLASRVWTIDLSLADRSKMTFPLIVGRTALKNHAIAVHTRRALLTRPRPRQTPSAPDASEFD